MKAPERLYVEVCEDGIFAFTEPPFAESVEYIRSELVGQSLQQEQPVEGLEEAAEEHSGLNFDRQMEYKSFWNDVDTFKAGAEWQKNRDDLETADLLAIAHLQGMEQQKAKMLEDAVEGVIIDSGFDDGTAFVTMNIPDRRYDRGDKVKVIVIKDDEK